MTVINTNVNALSAENALQVSAASLSSAMRQLSTGKRINSTQDDPAGMAIASFLTMEIKSLDQAVRNAGDATSLIQTAEGACNDITNMLQRMHELAVQAVNDTNASEQRGVLDLEFQQLKLQIVQIAENTAFGGTPVLNGEGGTTSNGLFSFQVGDKAGQTISIKIENFGKTTVAGGVGLTEDLTSAVVGSVIKIDTALNATLAMTKFDTVMNNINTARATMGAVMNRMENVINNLTNASINATEARSRIEDADYAKASSDLARAQIMQQAATAVLAQANSSQQTVLKLLQ